MTAAGLEYSPQTPYEPKRDATPATKGFFYQKLRTLLCWVNLGKGVRLYVEYAEDLLIVDGSIETSISVARQPSQGSITLSSAKVLAAIDHHWSRRRAIGRGTRARLWFISTERIGQENDASLGGIAGLERWELARQGGGDAEQHLEAIREFLSGRAALSNIFRAFLREATPGQILEEVITPIDWVTGEDDIEGIEASIDDRLVEIGEEVCRLKPTESRRLRAQLCSHLDTLMKEPEARRYLTRSGLRTLVEQLAAKIVPPREYDELTRSAAKWRVHGVKSFDSQHFVLEPTTTRVPAALDMLIQPVNRDIEVKLIRDCCAFDRLLPVVGRPGSGKSAIIQKYIAEALRGDGLSVGERPSALLSLDLGTARRPLRVLDAALATSADIPVHDRDTDVDELDEIGDGEDDHLTFLLNDLLMSQLGNRSLVAVLANCDRVAPTHRASLTKILDTEPFRHAFTLLETTGEVPNGIEAKMLPPLTVGALAKAHAVELFVREGEDEAVARAAADELEKEAGELFFPASILAASHRHRTGRAIGDVGCGTDLALSFVPEIAESVEETIRACLPAAPGLDPLRPLLAMAVLVNLPIAVDASLELPGDWLSPLRTLGWITSGLSIRLAGIAPMGLRALAAERLASGGEPALQLSNDVSNLIDLARDRANGAAELESALEEASRWLQIHAPATDLRRLVDIHLTQATVLATISPYSVAEERTLVEDFGQIARSGNFDAAISSLVLASRLNEGGDAGASPDARRNAFLAAIKTVEQSAPADGKMPSSQRESLDFALFIGCRRYYAFREALNCRLRLTHLLSPEPAADDHDGTGDLAVLINWHLNIADLQIGLDESATARASLLQARTNLISFLTSRRRLPKAHLGYWLGCRLRILESRVAQTVAHRVASLRKATHLAFRNLHIHPLGLRSFRFYLGLVNNLVRELSSDEPRHEVVEDARNRLRDLFGPEDTWFIELRARVAALMREEARRSWDIRYRKERLTEALRLLRPPDSGSADMEILGNGKAGFVEARILEQLGEFAAAEAVSDRVLALWPTAAGWRLKLRLISRQDGKRSWRPDLAEAELWDTKSSDRMHVAIRGFNDWAKKNGARGPAVGRTALWIFRHLMADQGSIERYAARQTAARGLQWAHLRKEVKANELKRIYSMRLHGLAKIERRYGRFVGLAIARLYNRAQYERSLAICLNETYDPEPVLRDYREQLMLWPDNHRLLYEFARYHRYLWDYSSALPGLRKVASAASDGDLRRQAAVGLVECLISASRYTELSPATDGRPSGQSELLAEAKQVLNDLGGHSRVAPVMALLRDHLAVELGEEVDWTATNALFGLLFSTDGSYLNSTLNHIEEITSAGDDGIPEHLYSAVAQQFTSVEMLRALGVLYLRHAMVGASSDALQDLERAYGVFENCALLERSLEGVELPMTSLQRGITLLAAARIRNSLTPFGAKLEGADDLLALALRRLHSAANRGIGAFAAHARAQAKAAVALRRHIIRTANRDGG